MAGVVPITRGVENQEFQVQLDGVEYIIRLLWQDRDESWYFELSDALGTPIWMGQRIATGVPLLFQCVNPLRPPGELITIDTADEDKDPGLDDFGDDGEEGNTPARIQMIYLEADDLAELSS